MARGGKISSYLQVIIRGLGPDQVWQEFCRVYLIGVNNWSWSNPMQDFSVSEYDSNLSEC